MMSKNDLILDETVGLGFNTSPTDNLALEACFALQYGMTAVESQSGIAILIVR